MEWFNKFVEWLNLEESAVLFTVLRILAVIVIGLLQVSPGPAIHQAVTRAAVKACLGPNGWQNSQVGYPADVQNSPVLCFAMEKAPMQQRRQGCTLATCFYVCAAKVVYHRCTGIPGDQTASSKLDGYRVFTPGLVPYILSMRANGTNITHFQAGLAYQVLRDTGEEKSKIFV